MSNIHSQLSRRYAPLVGSTAIVVFLGIGARVAAQQPSADDAARAFDAVSVKLHASLENAGRIIVNGSLFRANAVTARALIIMAFWEERRLLTSQILSGPSWIDNDRFDVIARADGTIRDLRSAAPLLRLALEERFQLRAHKEQREQTVYALTRRSGGRPLGPGLKPSTIDCGSAAAGAVPTSPRSGGGWCGGRFGDGSIETGGYTLPALVTSLSSVLQQVVLDESGLAGQFDVTLKWSPDSNGGGADGPSLFAAVEEQLGLKLEPRKASVDVLVIDQLQHPTPD